MVLKMMMDFEFEDDAGILMMLKMMLDFDGFEDDAGF